LTGPREGGKEGGGGGDFSSFYKLGSAWGKGNCWREGKTGQA